MFYLYLTLLFLIVFFHIFKENDYLMDTKVLECTMKSKNSNEISFKMFFVVEIACMCNDDE